MSDLSFQSILQEMHAEWDSARADLARVQETARNTTGEARSKGRQVSAKVDAEGRLTELKLHGQGYRTMPPIELTKLIMDTVNQAHENARRDLWQSVDGSLPPGTDPQTLADGGDWSTALPTELELPDLIRDVLERGLPTPGTTPTPRREE
ncbi:hypothetical protein GCM10027290_28260 [Micromonospora sonneratiae]|uniref:YbaB/EbfC family nucleoid-associated protein n=1 Tax=Micromonospora sonneratiae TaxID=1184706 RepID=A0ABW3Y8Z4_9ACTN